MIQCPLLSLLPSPPSLQVFQLPCLPLIGVLVLGLRLGFLFVFWYFQPRLSVALRHDTRDIFALLRRP